MKKNGNFFTIFLIFLLLSFLLFGLSRVGFFGGQTGFLGRLIFPFEKTIFATWNLITGINDDVGNKQLEDENKSLYKKLTNTENLEKENNALRDQFKTISPKSANLLPAKIVGAPSFIPNVTIPDAFIIDKGTKDGVVNGLAIVLKDNLVGRVAKTSDNFSEVTVLTNKNFSFTAKTSKTGALGVVRGFGSTDMVLDNVLLSESLEVGDLVLTKGELDIKGIGLPPDIIVGKIISVDKKPSSLFQSAKVQSLIDFSKLSEVFVVLGNQ